MKTYSNHNQNTRQGTAKRKTRRVLSYRKLFIFISVVLLVTIGVPYGLYKGFVAIKAWINRPKVEQRQNVLEKEPHFTFDDVTEFKGYIGGRRSDYKKLFCDEHDVQLPEAMSHGISPLDDDSMIPALLEGGSLVEVVDSPGLYLHQVTFPYLVPSAYEILHEIARRYTERIGPEKPLRLTSCLRTNDFVKRLHRRNVNSTTTSCHLFGTTFDISYSQMEGPEKDALARTLIEMRNAGYIYVIYEVKQPCFHITIRRDR